MELDGINMLIMNVNFRFQTVDSYCLFETILVSQCVQFKNQVLSSYPIF